METRDEVMLVNEPQPPGLSTPTVPTPTVPPPLSTPRPSNGPKVVLAVLLALVLGVGAFVVFVRRDNSDPVATDAVPTTTPVLAPTTDPTEMIPPDAGPSVDVVALQAELETARSEVARLSARVAELESAAGVAPDPEVIAGLEAQVRAAEQRLAALESLFPLDVMGVLVQGLEGAYEVNWGEGVECLGYDECGDLHGPFESFYIDRVPGSDQFQMVAPDVAHFQQLEFFGNSVEGGAILLPGADYWCDDEPSTGIVNIYLRISTIGLAADGTPRIESLTGTIDVTLPAEGYCEETYLAWMPQITRVG